MVAKVSVAMTPTSHFCVQFLIFSFHNRDSVSTKSYLFMIHLLPGHFTTLTNNILTLVCFRSKRKLCNYIRVYQQCSISRNHHTLKLVFTRTLLLDGIRRGYGCKCFRCNETTYRISIFLSISPSLATIGSYLFSYCYGVWMGHIYILFITNIPLTHTLFRVLPRSRYSHVREDHPLQIYLLSIASV